MHLKRNEMPRIWPIERKGTKYVARPLQSMTRGIPLVIAVRDMLKLAETARDVKNILKLGKIKVNGHVVREEKYPIALFNILSLDDKNFRLILKDKKLKFAEVSAKDSETMVIKIIGKKIVNDGKIQINLAGGRNYLTKEKVNVGDSAVIDLKTNKVSKILNVKTGSSILFINGKHIGELGKVESLDDKKNAVVIVNKDKINAKLESLMVVE